MVAAVGGKTCRGGKQRGSRRRVGEGRLWSGEGGKGESTRLEIVSVMAHVEARGREGRCLRGLGGGLRIDRVGVEV